MQDLKSDNLIHYFSKFITPERYEKIKTLAPERTRYITIVLEDIYQSHNASAIMRTCEALGVQDVHCILDMNEFEIKKNIALGSTKWLDLFYYRSDPTISVSPTEHCIQKLKQDGYTIVATSPHATMTLAELSLDSKIAFLFGTEAEGLTEEAIGMADELVQIPMYGFVESFNVSVSAALCLYDTTQRLRNSSIAWQLSEKEQHALMLDWLRNSVEHPEIIEREFFTQHLKK